MMASRLHSALLSLASVANQRDGGRGHRRRLALEADRQVFRRHFGGPAQPAEFRALLVGPAQNCGPSPMVADPTALTAARAPTVKPCGMRVLAEPRPPFRFTVVAPKPRAPQCPMQTPPRPPAQHRGRDPNRAALCVMGSPDPVLSPPLMRSNRIACTATGTMMPPNIGRAFAPPTPPRCAAGRIEAKKRAPTAPRHRSAPRVISGSSRLTAARARHAAERRHAGHRTLFEERHGDAGRRARVLGVADQHAWHVGDEIPHVKNSPPFTWMVWR